MELTQATNQIFAFLTLFGQGVIVLLIVSFIIARVKKKKNKVISFFGKHSLTFAFIVALAATLGSLFYSEVIGFEPCKFCWFQRIFIYPQVIILGVALWQRKRTFSYDIVILSAIGALISILHYYFQMTGTSILPCSSVGQSVSCGRRFVLEFGYITIAMMTLNAFLLIITLMASKWMYKKY